MRSRVRMIGMKHMPFIRYSGILAGLCFLMQPLTMAAGRWHIPNAVGLEPWVTVYGIQVDGQTRFIPVRGDTGMSDITELVRTSVYHTDLGELIEALRADGVDDSRIFAKAPCVIPIRASWMIVDGHFVVPDTLPPARHDETETCYVPPVLSVKLFCGESGKDATSSAKRLQAIARSFKGCELYKVRIDKKLRYVAVPGTNALVMAGDLVRATVSYLDFESLKKDVELCREGSIFPGFRPMKLPATAPMPSVETLPFTRRELEALNMKPHQ